MPAPPDYNDVPARIRAFREKYPEGTLCAADPTHPYYLETIGNETFLIYCAAAYRDRDDPHPGNGTAWELVPGKTNFTRGSEIQNAETSAWGRAIIAVGAADAKRVASDEEIESAQRFNAPRRPASKDRLDRAAARVKEADMTEQVKAEFKWPWTDEDCDAIAILVESRPM
jgi:hypothetical protein